MTISVIIVDATRLHCEGLAYLLRQIDGLSVVGELSDVHQSLSRIRELRPDIVLLHMAVPDGVALLRAIADAIPNSRVVALGVTENEEEVIACAEGGASGFFPREGSLGDLVATVQSVAGGETLCSPRIAATLLRRVAALASERQSWRTQVHLTPREREILQLIDRGLSNKEISRCLSVGVRTVKTHVHNILEKLQVHRRGEAAARMREGHGAGGGRVPQTRRLSPFSGRD